MNNGECGCGCHTICTHDPVTYAVVCTCSTGYTNAGPSSTVVCIGNELGLIIAVRYNLINVFQIVVKSKTVDVVQTLYVRTIQKLMLWYAHARLVIQILVLVQVWFAQVIFSR